MLYKSKKYDDVISEAASVKNLSLEDKKLAALSYFYKTDYEKAMVLFKEIALEKDDLESWFNCLNPLLILKRMREAKEVFEKLLNMRTGPNAKQPRELSIPFIRYYYACGLSDSDKFNEALEQLEELQKIYISLKITDGTFLYIRGVPFISSTLDLAKKCLTGLEYRLVIPIF